MPPIPAATIAEYVSLRAELENLRSRLQTLEQEHPGICKYFRARVHFVAADEDQILMNLHVLVSSDREVEHKVSRVIGRMRMAEEDAVMLLARKYWELGDIEAALKALG